MLYNFCSVLQRPTVVKPKIQFPLDPSLMNSKQPPLTTVTNSLSVPRYSISFSPDDEPVFFDNVSSDLPMPKANLKTPNAWKQMSKKEGKISTPRLDGKENETENHDDQLSKKSTKELVKIAFGFDESESEMDSSQCESLLEGISPVKKLEKSALALSACGSPMSSSFKSINTSQTLPKPEGLPYRFVVPDKILQKPKAQTFVIPQKKSVIATNKAKSFAVPSRVNRTENKIEKQIDIR